MSLTLDLSSVSHEWIETQGFLAGISQKGCAFLHKSYQGVQDVLMLGALTSVKVVSPWFLHYKFTVFSFVINKYLETLQRLCRQSFLLTLYLFILAPINGFVYRDDYSGILLVVSIFLIPSSFINWNFVRKISLSLPLLSCSFILVWTYRYLLYSLDLKSNAIIILLLKFCLWPLGSLSGWYPQFFSMLLVFEYFLSGATGCLMLIFYFSLQQLWNQPLLYGALFPYIGD